MTEEHSLDALLASLPPLPRQTLQALYDRRSQLGDDGLLHPVDATTRIRPEEGLELMALLKHAGADAVLEIGLAYGFSSQFLLAGLQQCGGGRLVCARDRAGAGGCRASGHLNDAGRNCADIRLALIVHRQPQRNRFAVHVPSVFLHLGQDSLCFPGRSMGERATRNWIAQRRRYDIC